MIYKKLSPEELVEKLKEQDAKRLDIVTPGKKIRSYSKDLYLMSDHLAGRNITPNEVARRQISDKLRIPWNYFERMREEQRPQIYDQTINYWFENSAKKYLLRMFDEGDYAIGRALLSDSYRPINNIEILYTVLQAVEESKMKILIETADITDKRLYIRFVAPEVQVSSKKLLESYVNPKDTNRGDGIMSGFTIRNSETGHGKFEIAPRAVVLVCKNGMIREKDVQSKIHVGAKLNEGIQWSERTRRSNTALIKDQLRDYVKHFSSKEYLQNFIQEVERKGNQQLDYPVETVSNVTDHFSLNENAKSEILNYFAKSNSMNAFGVSQALTFYAHEQDDPDLRNDIEGDAVSLLDNIKQFDYAKN